MSESNSEEFVENFLPLGFCNGRLENLLLWNGSAVVRVNVETITEFFQCINKCIFPCDVIKHDNLKEMGHSLSLFWSCSLQYFNSWFITL